MSHVVVVSVLFFWFYFSVKTLRVKRLASTGCRDRWARSDWDPGYQEQRADPNHECSLSRRWVGNPNDKDFKDVRLVSVKAGSTVLSLTAYKKTLEEALQSETSGHFCRILVSLVQVTFVVRTLTVCRFHAHSLVTVWLVLSAAAL